MHPNNLNQYTSISNLSAFKLNAMFLITIDKSTLRVFIKNAKRRYFIACATAVLYLVGMLPYLFFP